jgi:hypothetical protein
MILHPWIAAQDALALAAAKSTQKKSPEKSSLIHVRACVGGQIVVPCIALLGLFFYFKTSANKLVNLIVGLKVTLSELVINAVAWISIPNEPRDLYEKATICSERGIAPL